MPCKKELHYYKNVIKEQEAIIKQLLKQPSDVEYIHPLDLTHLINTSPSYNVVGEGDILEIEGKKYKQTAYIPAKNTAIK